MNTEQSLEQRAELHGALSDVTRLRIVDLLAVGDASASELGAAVAIPSNLLAFHLKVLEKAGLVVRQRSEGDARRWYLSLTADAAAVAAAATPGTPPRRVVFVCTANTARSHLAAALWRRASRVQAASAGTHPGERIAAGAVDTATRHGLKLPAVAPSLLDLQDGDLVITVCDRAHEELGDLGWAHWSIPDPVPEGSPQAFDAAYERLAARVNTLAPRLASAS
jgi:ArsR family transcriptional regulator, arsenate/arsenite/antimonite-responsive transcriptional repressor / arsenate reductase (thioredoxin)